MSKKIKKCFKKTLNGKYVKIVVFFLLFVLFVIFIFNFLFFEKIFPGIYISNIYVGGKTHEEAKVLLQSTKFPPTIILKDNDMVYEIELENIDLAFDIDSSINAAFSFTKTGNILEDQIRRISSLFKKKKIGFRLKFDDEKLNQELFSIIEKISTLPIYPSVKFIEKKVQVERGETGTTVDFLLLKANVESSLSLMKDSPVEIKKEIIDRRITDSEAEILHNRALSLVGQTLTLTHEFDSFTFREVDLFSLLDPKGEYLEKEIESLILEVAKKVNRNPQNSKFSFVGGKVTEFTPSKDGVTIKKDVLFEMIVGNLRTLEGSEETFISINIPIDSFPPEISTDEVNNLGINELVGRGTSKFAGSISSRIYNIGHASKKLDGILISPGDVFSFNETVGDVSTLTGYKQAYIIKDGQTVLGDGGGLCQVSTTLFRAVLDTGLPVVERRAHSYRVGYYEQDSALGLDATVYSPTTDFKFKNNTPGHLLIQTYFYPKSSSLVFEIYGTSDGRESSISKSIVWDVSPPPEDLYTDDPSLPLGQIKQVDYKSWGAKARFTYTVKKAGETLINKVFYSTYQPWQAKFLRGTGIIN